jgi:hypothetical protein
MSSLEIARATLWSTEPEQTVVVEWRKHDGFVCAVLEPTEEEWLSREVKISRHATKKSAMAKFCRIVNEHQET